MIMITCTIRNLVSMLVSLAVASAILAGMTMWRLLHDPVGLTTSSSGLLLPLARLIGHTVVNLARHL